MTVMDADEGLETVAAGDDPALAVTPVEAPGPAPVQATSRDEPQVHGLDPQFVPLQRAIGWIVTACISGSALVVVAGLWFAADMPWVARMLLFPGWLVLSAALAWLFYTWPAVHYRHVAYIVDAEGIEIRSGVWWRSVTSVPRSRVQHIDVSQGPMERAYGLGRLVLYTAGTDHSRVELAGLRHAEALALRNHLLPQGVDDAI